MNLLHIDSSILGASSVSRTLTKAVVDQWKERNADAEVIYRDLAANPAPHLTGEILQDRAGAAPSGEHMQILEEFLAADIVVIGAPMYNFSVPSQLKAWLDHLAVAGKTFSYGSGGPVGLAGGKRVIVVSTRGGFYNSESALAAWDFQERYLGTFFSFLGIENVEFICAEGVATGREKAIAAASQAIAAAA